MEDINAVFCKFGFGVTVSWSGQFWAVFCLWLAVRVRSGQVRLQKM